MDDGDNHDWRYCGTGSHLGKLCDAAPPPDAKANLVRVIKSERRLTLYKDGRLIKSYAIALGRSPIGQKEGEGDGRTPNGCIISIPGSWIVLSIGHCILLIPTCAILAERSNNMLHHI